MERVLDALAAGATVVSANNRLARSIRLAFDRRQRAAGLRAWPTPQVLPWSAWITSLWETSATGGGTAGQFLLLDDFQCRLVWRQVAESSDAVADLAADAWSLARSWQVGPLELARTADSDDAVTFAAWAGRYVDRCRDLRLADTGAIVPRLVEDIGCGIVALPARMHFVGFDEWTPLQRSVLLGMATADRTIVEEPAPRAVGARRVRIGCPDRGAELDTAARWARARMETAPSRSIAIVVPDLASRTGEVRRAVLDIVAPRWRSSPDGEWPANFSYGRSLADHGLVHTALIGVRALRGSLGVVEAGQLLRSPYIGGHATDGTARARLDLSIRERIGADIPVRELLTRARPVAPRLADALESLQSLTGRLPRVQAASDWAELFRTALVVLGWPGDRPLASDEFQCATAAQTLWDALRGCERPAGRMTLDGALALVEQLARRQRFQPAGHAEGLQVLGTLEAMGHRFDATWLCGMTADAWPAPAKPSPLIALGLQRERGMPDSSPANARERAERRLRWLEESAPEFVASWPQFDGEEPFSASPLIERLPDVTSAELHGWPGTRWRDALADARVAELVVDDPAPAVPNGARIRGGVGLLARQATCPARAFLEFRLGARELCVPAIGIDAGTRGSIVHSVLERFYGQVRSHDELMALSAREETVLLDELIGAAIARRVPADDVVFRRLGSLEAERLKPLLQQFLAGERRRSGFVVRAVESMPAEAARPPLPLSALNISVRPDRVDELSDGGRLVIDYKTGRELPPMDDLFKARPRAPQLPLYSALLGARGLAFVHLGAAGVAWRGIGPPEWALPGVVDVNRATKGEFGDWDSLRARWWSALSALAEEILEGSFLVERWHHEEARGQWAMATRVCELREELESG